MYESIRRLGMPATAVAALLFLSTQPASAEHDINSCNNYCDTTCPIPPGDCRLAQNGFCQVTTDETNVLTCNEGDGPIRLKNGTDLDLHGKTIKCADGANCGDAILIEDTNSHVFNGASSEGIVTGGFINGVNCGGFNGSEVIGITISKTIVGTRNCKTVINNVIKTLGRTYLAANWGILTTGVTATGDVISDNYIEGHLYGIQIDGTTKPRVENNVVHTTHFGSCAIRLTNSGSEARVLGNTILGTGNAGFTGVRKVICIPSPAPIAAQFSGNVCDEDHPDCISCTQTLVSGQSLCVPFTSPFLP